MVHKKYTYRNGKLYGPYLYENKRVGEKVITTYVGKDVKNVSNVFKNNLLLFFGIIFLFTIAFALVYYIVSPTGKTIVNVFQDSESGRLSGTLKMSLKEGELIPKDAMVIALLNNQSNEIHLNEVVGETAEIGLHEGNYFMENANLEGSGLGYGIQGEKLVYPEIEFELLVYDKDIEKISGDGIDSEEQVEEVVEAEGVDDDISEEEIDETEIVDEEITDEESQEIIEEDNIEDNVIGETESGSGEENNEEIVEEEINEESIEDDGDTLITGSLISGMIISEDSLESDGIVVKGIVSKDQDFIYELGNNKEAIIVSGSVKYNDDEIDDNELNLIIENGLVKISTEYSIIEKGFGQDYLGQDSIDLDINISDFKIITEQGNLEINLNYQEKIIGSYEKEIILEEINDSDIIVDELVINETIEEMIDVTSNISVNISILKDIPRIRLFKNEPLDLVLSEYFRNAQNYKFVGENIIANISQDIMTLRAEQGFRGARKAKIIASSGNESVESNEFMILVSSGAVKIKTLRGKIKVGEPVKWIKNVSLMDNENFTVELPKEAENIIVKKVDEQGEEEIDTEIIGLTGSVIRDIENENAISRFFNRLFRAVSLTGRAVLDEQSNENNESLDVILTNESENYVIEYETPGPILSEIESDNKRKIVMVSGPEGLNYSDVIANVSIDNARNIINSERIKIYWKQGTNQVVKNVSDVASQDLVVVEETIDDINNSGVENDDTNENEKDGIELGNVEIPFDAYDLDADGYIDYLEWIVPHLSNQTFEIILVIKAEHLDSEREFIADIYDEVKELDGVWSPGINDSEYVRVVFEYNLSKDRDITVYPRILSGQPRIEVYEIGDNEIIAEFENLDSEKYNKVYLSGLNGSQDSFDLRIIGGSLEVDHIIDPVANYNLSFVFPTPADNAYTTNNSVIINVSLDGVDDMKEMKWNWNGTNYTIYNDSLVLLMNFDNLSAIGENATYVVDASRWSNNGSVLAGLNWTPSGKYGGAYNFSRVDPAYIRISSFKNGTTNKGGTVAFWLYHNQKLSDDGLVMDDTLGVIAFDDDGPFRCGVGNISGTAVGGPNDIRLGYDMPLNVWTHYVCTWNTTTMAVYVNGSLATEDTDVSGDYRNITDLYIGNDRDIAGRTTNSTIDELMIWTRGLSAEEIYEVYASNLWKFNESRWYYYVNQSKNVTNALTNSSYTYQVFVKDTSDGENFTEQRTVTIGEAEEYPQLNFVTPTPADDSSTTNTTIEINVSIIEGNLEEVKWNWNGTNFTMYNDSLILMMGMNNLSAIGENQTHVVDVSKYSNNGTTNGGMIWNTTGRYGGGWQFFGDNDYITVPDSSVFSPYGDGTKSGQLSVFAWIKPSNIVTDDQYILLKGSGGNWEYALIQKTNDLSCLTWKNSGSTYYSITESNVFLTNTWYHVGFVLDYQPDGTGNLTIYLDGENVGIDVTNGTSIMSDDTGDLEIGARTANNWYYNGTIDEVQIWNRSLSDDEVYQLYASSLYKHNSTQWYLYVNQSKNASDILVNGTYTYQVFAKDIDDNENWTEQRTVTVGGEYPILNFVAPTPDNATTTSNTTIQVNVSIEEDELKEFKWNWNGTNYTIYNDSLVLFMNLNNLSDLGENDTHVVDVSKWSNNGTAKNNPVWSSDGKYGGGFVFDGYDYIEITDTPEFDISDEGFTYTAWINATAVPNSFNMFMGHYLPYFNVRSNKKVHLSWHNGSNQQHVYSASTIDLGKWYFVAARVNESYSGQIFINGIADGEFNDSYAPVNNYNYNMYIGTWYSGLSYNFTGSIGEVQVWNRSLSDDEIQQFYMSNLWKYNSTQWYFYVNQSKNASAELDKGKYTYQALAKDTNDDENWTEIREITIGEYPLLDFVAPTPDNSTITSNTTIQVNVSIEEDTLKEFKWNWNGTNYTMYNDSLLLYMNFNNLSDLGENDSHVVDVSKWSNNGTVLGGAVWNTSGKYGGAWSFDGVDASINVSKDIFSSGFEEYTISVWMISDDSNGVFFTQYHSGVCGDMQFGLTSNNAFIHDGGSNTVRSYIDLDDGLWHHIVAVSNDTNTSLYIDGIWNVTGVDVDWDEGCNADVRIGSDYDDRYLSGSIDELMFWNRTLNAEEIYTLYASNLWKYNSTQWYFYVNQSKNASDELDKRKYTYQALAKNVDDNENWTEIREITIGEYSKLNFIFPTPDNGTTTSNRTIQINVSIEEDSLKDMKWYWNGTNYTMYNDSLVLMLGFNNLSDLGENDTHVVDVSKWSNNGTVLGGAIWNSSGKRNGAYTFDGEDDYINFSNSKSGTFDIKGSLTLSAWIYINNISAYAGIIAKADDGSWLNNQYALGLDTEGDELRFILHNNTGEEDLRGTSDMQDYVNQWAHVAAVFDADNQNMTIYLNGLPDGSKSTGSSSVNSSDAPVWIGREFGDNFFNGSIDEPRIWNRSFTRAEIEQMYMSNLWKYNSTLWYLYVNQSKDGNNGLDDGNYTYQAFGEDKNGYENFTDFRIIYIGDYVNPGLNFTFPTPPNDTSTTNRTIQVNVSIAEYNLRDFIWAWNETNFTIYNDSLLLMLSMDNLSTIGENDTHVVDVSKWSINGTARNGAYWNDSGGRYNGGFVLDGDDDFIDLGNPDTLNITDGSFSYGMWVYAYTSVGSWDMSWYKGGSSAGNPGYDYELGTGGWIANLADGDEVVQIDVGDTVTGQWVHIFTVIDRVSQRGLGYKDGMLYDNVSIATLGSVEGDEDARIGISTSGNYPFNGTVDEVLIFNRSLSSEEIYQIYTSNLWKYNMTQWYYYVNQSKNASTELDLGEYTYQVFGKDRRGNENFSELRTIIIGNSSITNCDAGCLYVRDINGNNVAIFDKRGYADIKRSLSQNGVGTVPDNSFIVRNASGDNVAYIDSRGSMKLASILYENVGSDCNPSVDSFILKNDSGSCVMYINETGGLYLRHDLVEYAVI